MKPQSVSETIQDVLTRKIVSGDWPPGHKLPTEHELARQYRCARMTVSKAIGALAGKGLVTRRRRAGTVVAAPRAQETVLEIHDIQAEILAAGHAYAFQRKSRQIRPATDEDAARLGIAAGTPVLAVTGVHFADGAAHALEQRLINLSAVPEARKQGFVESPPGSWLLAQVPWTEAEHQIYAEAAEARTARWLKVDRKAACLCVERHTWRGDESITHVRLIYAGSTHRLIARFQRHS